MSAADAGSEEVGGRASGRGESVALVLAAGSARRFGEQKLLAEYRGGPLIRRTVENALASSADRVVVVVGHRGEAVARALEGLEVRTVPNPDHDEGIAASIRAGVSAVRDDADAVLILLGDQPEAGPALLDRVLGADPEGAAEIVVPVYREGPGNPVLFRASVFSELLELEGDRGARSVVERDRNRVREVVLDRSIPRDVDTPVELRELERRRG